MRALFVTNRYPPDGFGGYERVAASAVGWLRGRGHEVRVLTTAGAPSSAGVARELEWWWRDGAWVRPGWRERRRIVRRDVAAVREHADGCDVVAWWAMGGLPLAVIGAVEARSVGVVHDGWLVYGPEVDAGPRGFDPGRVARWLVNSRAVLERAREAWPGLEAEVLSPGVDAEAFPARPARPWRWRLLCPGRIAPETLDNLEHALGRTRQHTVVCMHHPPASTCDNPYCGIVNAAEAMRVLRRHRHVRAVLSGHLHRAFDHVHDGIRFLGAPSTCVQLMHGGSPHFRPTSAPPAARLLELHGDGAITYETVSARYADSAR